MTGYVLRRVLSIAPIMTAKRATIGVRPNARTAATTAGSTNERKGLISEAFSNFC